MFMLSNRVFLIIIAVVIFVGLVIYNLNNILKTRATGPELNLKIKLQGDYRNISNPSIKSKAVLYTANLKIKDYQDQVLTQENQNVFALKLSLADIDLTKLYAIFIKPEKYLGRLFCGQTVTSTDCKSPQFVFQNNQNTIDLSNQIFLSGDLDPADGKVNAYDLSLIIGNLGKIASSRARTDINSDLITDTQDYSLALYSLGKNAVDDVIPFPGGLTPTPTLALSPTVGLSPTPTTTTPTTKPTKKPTPTKKPKKTPTPTQKPTGSPSATPTPINCPFATQTDCFNSGCSQDGGTCTQTGCTNNKWRCNYLISGGCPQMDNGLPNSIMHYPDGYTGVPKTTKQIWSWQHQSNYSLPYRNPNCTVTQENIQKAYEKMKTFYPGEWQATKLLTDWQTVQYYSKKYNFNPAFVISLWIRESVAGGFYNSKQLGCVFRLNKDGSFTELPGSSTICEQMECLFGRKSVVPDNFGLWACQYQLGSGKWDNQTQQCLEEPNFTQVLHFWYEYYLSEGLPDECQIKYCPNAPGC